MGPMGDMMLQMLGLGTPLINFATLRETRGALSAGGSHMQLLSSAQWQRKSADDTDETEAGHCAADSLALRFWLREDRLEQMLDDGWHAYVITTDTWQACLEDPTAMSEGDVVRRVEVFC